MYAVGVRKAAGLSAEESCSMDEHHGEHNVMVNDHGQGTMISEVYLSEGATKISVGASMLQDRRKEDFSLVYYIL